jgi:hypothetical protein
MATKDLKTHPPEPIVGMDRGKKCQRQGNQGVGCLIRPQRCTDHARTDGVPCRKSAKIVLRELDSLL